MKYFEISIDFLFNVEYIFSPIDIENKHKLFYINLFVLLEKKILNDE